MSRVTTTVLVVGAVLVALAAAGVALAVISPQVGAVLAGMVPCSDHFDYCHGTGNPDRILESSGNDDIRAGRGDDDVDAARFAEDTDGVLGGRGDDTVNTADGDPFDTISCGKGKDVAIVNPGDDVAGGCEDTAAGGPRPIGE